MRGDPVTNTYFPAPGELVDPAELKIAKARDLVQLLLTGRSAFVELIECRAKMRRAHRGRFVIDVEVERGQHVVHEINGFERIAVRFYASDRARMPETLALRESFPEWCHI